MERHRPFFLLSDGGYRRSTGSLLQGFEGAISAAPKKIAALIIRERVKGSGFREASDEELLNLLQDLKPLCLAHSICLIVHGDLDLVVAGHADGVHLNARSTSPQAARAKLSPDAVIGYSAHSFDEAREVVEQGADYVLFSPVFPPLSKTATRLSLGLEKLKEASAALPEHLVALGGISKENISSCREAGASRIAMISSVIGAEDTHQAMRDIVKAWEEAEMEIA